jgi:hypothetical protein
MQKPHHLQSLLIMKFLPFTGFMENMAPAMFWLSSVMLFIAGMSSKPPFDLMKIGAPPIND